MMDPPEYLRLAELEPHAQLRGQRLERVPLAFLRRVLGLSLVHDPALGVVGMDQGSVLIDRVRLSLDEIAGSILWEKGGRYQKWGRRWGLFRGAGMSFQGDIATIELACQTCWLLNFLMVELNMNVFHL